MQIGSLTTLWHYHIACRDDTACPGRKTAFWKKACAYPWTCLFKFVVGSIPCSARFAYGTNVRCGCATSKSSFIHLFLLILLYSLILFIILLNFSRDYLRSEQPYTSTLIVIAEFQVCGRNLRYIAWNTWTSLRTTVFWSVLPVRICRVKREQRLWSKLSCLS